MTEQFLPQGGYGQPQSFTPQGGGLPAAPVAGQPLSDDSLRNPLSQAGARAAVAPTRSSIAGSAAQPAPQQGVIPSGAGEYGWANAGELQQQAPSVPANSALGSPDSARAVPPVSRQGGFSTPVASNTSSQHGFGQGGIGQQNFGPTGTGQEANTQSAAPYGGLPPVSTQPSSNLGQPAAPLGASFGQPGKFSQTVSTGMGGSPFGAGTANPGFAPGATAVMPNVIQPAAVPTSSEIAEEEAPTRRGRGIIETDQNAGGRVGMSNSLRAGDVIIDELLREVVENDASDMHLTDRSYPMIRKAGALRPLEGYEPMTAESLRRSLFAMLTQKQREKFEEVLELDFAYQVPNGSRYRVNLYQQRDSVGAAFRVIPSEIRPLEDLGVPPSVSKFSTLPRGLVLVTGPTGSGKSTTLASIIDLANRTRPDHIMTVEDPIEFLHDHKKALVNQREVGTDTWSFAAALKHVLRQDPDIILVGEMRDLETISVALTAAETGHLVFATLHTQDAAQTIDRVIDVFPPEQQEQIRVQLAAAIQGVVCQTLCKRADGPGRVVATEVMVATPAIRNLIREGKTHQIYSSMQAGAGEGMHTMDQHLADLTKRGKISYETGLDKCHNAADYNRLSGRRPSSANTQIAAAGMGGNLNMGSN